MLRNATAFPSSRTIAGFQLGQLVQRFADDLELALDGRPHHIVGQIGFSVSLADVARDRIGRPPHIPSSARGSRCIQCLFVALDCGSDVRVFHAARSDQIDPATEQGGQRPSQSKELVQTRGALAAVILNQNIDVGSRRVEIRPAGSGADRLEPRDTKASAQVGDFIAAVSKATVAWRYMSLHVPDPARPVAISGLHAGGLSPDSPVMDADCPLP